MKVVILCGGLGARLSEETKVRQEMESFNKKMNGRLFEISSWEGKDLLIDND